MRYRKIDKSYLIIVLIMLVFVTVGFALLQSNLRINGTVETRSNSWNIYFDNIVLNQDSVSKSLPTITERTSLNFAVELSEMGDFYEFTVDVVNDGTIDAMINTITATSLTSSQAKIIDLSYTYEDGTSLGEKDYLKANTRDILKVLVKYKDDINPEDLANSGISLPISLDIEYVQADDTVNLQSKNYKIVTMSNPNGNVSDSISIKYGETKNVTVTPDTGYYISSFICDGGYTVSGGATGSSAITAKTFTVNNSNNTCDSTCTASFSPRSFNVVINKGEGIASTSVAELSVPYNGNQTFTYTVTDGYEYENVTCTNNYTASRSGTTITVTNSGNTSTSTCTITARLSNYAATKVLDAATSSQVKCGHWSPTRGAAADANHGCSWKWFRCDGCGLEQQHYTCTAENGSGWGAGSHYNTVYSCSIGTLEGSNCATYTCPKGGTLSGTNCIIQ